MKRIVCLFTIILLVSSCSDISPKEKEKEIIRTKEYDGIEYDACFHDHNVTIRSESDHYELFDQETKTVWIISDVKSGKNEGIKLRKGYFEGDLFDHFSVQYSKDYRVDYVYHDHAFYIIREDGQEVYVDSGTVRSDIEDAVHYLITIDPYHVLGDGE